MRIMRLFAPIIKVNVVMEGGWGGGVCGVLVLYHPLCGFALVTYNMRASFSSSRVKPVEMRRSESKACFPSFFFLLAIVTGEVFFFFLFSRRFQRGKGFNGGLRQ